MRPIEDPLDDVPEDAPELLRRQPLGSPYAVPLGTLTGGAYVAVTDQVQEQPTDGGGIVSGPSVGGYADSD